MRPLNVLDWEYYHNTVRDWLTALAILACVFVLLTIVRKVAHRRLLRKAPPALRGARARESLLTLIVRRTRYFFLFAIALGLASLSLTLPPRWEQMVRGIAIVAFLLQIAIWGDGIIGVVLHFYIAGRSTPSGDDAGDGGAASRTTVAALGVVARIVLWILIGLIALDSLGVHVTTLIAGLGVTGIALALAVQNILGDLFAALSIVLDKPFVVGDPIAVDGLGGTVERIGLKTTRVRSNSGEQIIFSNGDLLKSRIRNYRRLRERTITLAITLDQTATAKAIGSVPPLIREVVQAQPGVRLSRSHVTIPTSQGIATETVYVVESPDYTAYMDAQQAITLGILSRLNETGASLAAAGGVTIIRDQSGGGPPVDTGPPAKTPAIRENRP
jgi:small-conductance mechanosensitive channel